MKLSGNIKRNIQSTPVILRPTRIQEVVSYFLSIQEHIKMPQTGDIRDSPFQGFLHIKFFTELRQSIHTDLLFRPEPTIHFAQSMYTRRNNLVFFIFFQRDPAGFIPILFSEKSHTELIYRTPSRYIPLLIPNTYFPIIRCSGFQGCPRKRYQN